jgi:hypothetical protein
LTYAYTASTEVAAKLAGGISFSFHHIFALVGCKFSRATLTAAPANLVVPVDNLPYGIRMEGINRDLAFTTGTLDITTGTVTVTDGNPSDVVEGT